MGKIIIVEDAAEYATLSHMREWCHDSTVCALCRVENKFVAAEHAAAGFQ
jgi:hypothetical protein